MTKNQNIGIDIDFNRLIDTRLLIQAGSGGGKSYLLRKLIETIGTQTQQIIIDPEGEFVTLREKFDFALVAKEGEIPLNLKYAETLAHKLLETNLSAIIDLYELKHHERILFVQRFVNALVNAPKELWHPCFVLIDEAHIFAPESSKSESLSAIIDICTRGRKRGFSPILATQRLSKLHKDAAAECQNKMIGITSIDIDRKRASEELGITNKTEILKLRELKPGEFYAFGPAISNEVTKFKVLPVITTHLQSGKRIAKTPPTPKAIEKILSKLSSIPEEAEKELNTRAQMQNEINRLKMELSKKPVSNIANPENELLIKKQQGIISWYEKTFDKISKEISDFESNISRLLTTKPTSVKFQNQKLDIKLATPQEFEKSVKDFPSVSDFKPNTSGMGTLGKCAKAILSFLSSYERGFTKIQIGVACGYSPSSGGFNNALSELTSKGFILRGEKIKWNKDSFSQTVNEVGPLSQKQYDISTFMENLDKCEREIYTVLLAQPYEGFSKESLAKKTQTNYSPTSGGFNNALSRLNTLGLIKRESGSIRLNPELLELM